MLVLGILHITLIGKATVKHYSIIKRIRKRKWGAKYEEEGWLGKVGGFLRKSSNPKVGRRTGDDGGHQGNKSPLLPSPELPSGLSQRQELKKAIEEHAEKLWDGLSWKDKYTYIFNLWFAVALAASCCSIYYGARFFFDRNNHEVLDKDDMKIALGFAVATFWVSLAQFLEYSPRFYLLFWTLKVGLPRVLQFFVGIFPFFIGYALLGMTLFGDQVEMFGSLQLTCCTLFSVVNGDSILDVFNSLEYSFPIGSTYIYVFIIIFMYVALMSIIAIVEEAFFDCLRVQGLQNERGRENIDRDQGKVRKAGGSERFF